MTGGFWTKVAALIVVVILLLAMTAHQVRFTETAVVLQFDKVKRVIQPEEAGTFFAAPWPISRVRKFDARLRAFETEFTQLSTSDQKTITMAAFALWRIADPEQFLKAIGREEAAAEKIGDLLKNQVSNVLRRHPLSHLVNVDPERMRFDQIEHEILDGIQQEAMDEYGVSIASVGIKRLGLPESNTREVFERMKADREKEIKALVAEGDARASQIRSDAEQMAQKILTRAEAYAQKLRGEGDAQAARYYSEFQKSPELSNFLKRIDATERIFRTGKVTVVFDADRHAPFDVLKESSAGGLEPTPGSPVRRGD
jgi:membrane protease subunit HflC